MAEAGRNHFTKNSGFPLKKIATPCHKRSNLKKICALNIATTETNGTTLLPNWTDFHEI
jgi:hypothetical protein